MMSCCGTIVWVSRIHTNMQRRTQDGGGIAGVAQEHALAARTHQPAAVVASGVVFTARLSRLRSPTTRCAAVASVMLQTLHVQNLMSSLHIPAVIAAQMTLECHRQSACISCVESDHSISKSIRHLCCVRDARRDRLVVLLEHVTPARQPVVQPRRGHAQPRRPSRDGPRDSTQGHAAAGGAAAALPPPRPPRLAALPLHQLVCERTTWGVTGESQGALLTVPGEAVPVLSERATLKSDHRQR